MKKRILSLILVLIFPLLLLSGCSEKKFAGEICELEFKESYTTTLLIPISIFNGKTVSIIMVPYIRTYPDRWYVKVRDYNEEEKKYDYNECYVTEECFKQLKIGDWFVYDEEYCYENEPYTQVKE